MIRMVQLWPNFSKITEKTWVFIKIAAFCCCCSFPEISCTFCTIWVISYRCAKCEHAMRMLRLHAPCGRAHGRPNEHARRCCFSFCLNCAHFYVRRCPVAATILWTVCSVFIFLSWTCGMLSRDNLRLRNVARCAFSQLWYASWIGERMSDIFRFIRIHDGSEWNGK